MSPFFVMAIQSTLTIVIMAYIARWYIAPSLRMRPLREKLEPLLLVHAFRFVLLAIFLPGQVAADFPGGLARTIAYGDFASGLLALAALLAWRYREAHGYWLTALFSVVGTADMVIVLAAAMNAQVYNLPLGFIYYIPAFYVPVLMVLQVMIFAYLVDAWRVGRTRVVAEHV
ncbi:MAG: hypothetical protein WDZ83_05160 [Rhizobiaceae bacterium]